MRKIGHHCAYHIGPGIIASVAYFDPGNWTVDLQAGAEYGYSLLFVVLIAGLGAVLLQVLACRMGVITGLDLAQHCRRLLYPRKLTRYFGLYPLYFLSEAAIIFTDLAELLGSAIALNLIFPSLPLWAGVLITSADVLVILALWRPAPDGGLGKAGRAFEAGIIILCLAVLGCFVVLIVRVGPLWGPVFKGFIPNGAVFQPNGLYISIGILGATVMPHAIFLGSALATQSRHPAHARAAGLARACPTRNGSTEGSPTAPQLPALLPLPSITSYPSSPVHAQMDESPKSSVVHPSVFGKLESLFIWDPRMEAPRWEGNNSMAFVRAHLGHATTDIVCSLLLLALVINSAILILGGTAFYYHTGPSPDADIFSAHALLSDKLGPPAAFLFAFALLCSGQSASVTATMAGQVVSEGFLEWRVSPFARRLLTRLIGLIPSTIVAVTAGRTGLDTLLVASQVALSICLPGVILPLLWVTGGRKARMEVVLDETPFERPSSAISAPQSSDVQATADVHPVQLSQATAATDAEQGSKHVKSYANHWTVNVLGWLLFVAICLANGYAIVELCLGNSG
ncbi:natural resistance-associated macrophage protein [Dacryopinax primogenitus]|uniref:Natural resistance-associated macrophage protein n=1 Tax=Dacryopinax primogenitus (strain DJM 731) TaxID=1858805 RepID=M5GB13_DACPD|nr:natural resistance-associated macrophage protein [Dacryopinax primogenitus]EJU01138.1 natural resistance-associated macrophage protein [Dacryopinax primogenitus]